MRNDQMILVKLGGSVITDKSKLRKFRRPTCDRLSNELATAKDRLLAVHGAGSFGHIEAKRHQLQHGYRRESQIQAVASVQRDVRELNLRVLESLIDAGVRAVSIPPASAGTFSGGKMQSFSKSAFQVQLDLGLTPVSFGDVVPDSTMGFSICSGDLVMEALAKAFRPELVVFVADVDGVFDRDPKASRNAVLISALDGRELRKLRKTGSKNADVTGSIYGKLERMLAISEYCEKCMIVNGNVPERLKDVLAGREVVSTLVVPG